MDPLSFNQYEHTKHQGFFFCQIMLRINPLKYIFGKKMNFSFIVRCLSLEDFRALGVIAIMLFEEITPSSCHQHF